MNSHMLQQAELLEITGCTNLRSLILHLNDCGIKYHRVGVRGKIYTTVEAMNAAMGLWQTPSRKSAPKIAEPLITLD